MLISQNPLHAKTVEKLQPISQVEITKTMKNQLDFGPRYPGSEGIKLFRDYFQSFVDQYPNWVMREEPFQYKGVTLVNIFVHERNYPELPQILIGAHYDTRKRATKDPNYPTLPILGANDGASGVSSIMELIRVMNKTQNGKIGFVLFDGEDQGFDTGFGMEGWEWIVGSTHFVDFHKNEINNIKNFILLDMIANKNLQIFYEGGSNLTLASKIWDVAHKYNFTKEFVKKVGYYLIDDHTPFVKAGVNSVDIIDFNYPEHHTLADDLQSISTLSITIVTKVVYEWINLELQPTTTKISQSLSTKTPATLFEVIAAGALSLIIIVKKSGKRRNGHAAH